MDRNFSQQISDFVSKSKARTKAVIEESAKEVVTRAQRPAAEGGSMPVVTANLRNSLVVAISGNLVGKGGDSHITALARYKLGDEIFIGWTAAYARRMEYGFDDVDKLGRVYRQQGYGFLRKAAQKWPSIVYNNARSLERLANR